MTKFETCEYLGTKEFDCFCKITEGICPYYTATQSLDSAYKDCHRLMKISCGSLDVENVMLEALKHYGMSSQFIILMEECAELIVVVSKALRNSEPFPSAIVDNLAEEIELNTKELNWS